MQQISTFFVYNASAGSGKTFTLVKEYLKILLVSNDIFTFRKILAITFTNKAAAEMKERVLKSLKECSEGKRSALLALLKKEIKLEGSVLQTKSKKILEAILQEYTAFNITTIDSFSYRIVKSFALDLGLSQNFEVEMDAQEFLEQAVEGLISKIGLDKELTETLIEYSLRKVDDDKSWDISRDLSEFSKILLNEEELVNFRKFNDQSLQDFKRVQQKLIIQREKTLGKMKLLGKKALNSISDQGLEHKDFYRSMLPNHFLSLVEKPNRTKFFDQSTLKKKVEDRVLYATSKSSDVIASIEAILPQILAWYDESESLYQELVQTGLLLTNIIPLAVLNAINQELNRIKEQNNIRLNAEFNQLISESIQDQPAPFIYERIGQRFMHYFIDEMQDTSILQWKNLIPLIHNSLAQENTSLLLVGDAKQAIYRWRGGKVEQFAELGSEDELAANPFLAEKKVRELSTNFRSCSVLIHFNNSFFKYVSRFLQDRSYANLFLKKSFQRESEKKGGCVTISFLKKLQDKEEDGLKYAKKVHQIIQQLTPATHLGSICILVRKRSEGVAIANYLSEKQLEIVSSETLLLSTSERVIFIVNFLTYSIHSNDKEVLFELLYFLHKHLQVPEDTHTFIEKLIDCQPKELFEYLGRYHCPFDLTLFLGAPLYEKAEQIIRAFHLQVEADAYVQFFLDEVLAQQRKKSTLQDFLDFWEQKKETLSIAFSENKNAVKIMTIHKSKGLEFPVVIFPCNLNIYQDIDPKAWLESTLDDFPPIMVPLRKEIQYVSSKGREIYDKRRTVLELDSFNLFYVALTRAVSQLHIITERKKYHPDHHEHTYFSGILTSFLKERKMWDEEKSEYVFGNPVSPVSTHNQQVPIETQKTFISTPLKRHNLSFLPNSSSRWGLTTRDQRGYGTLVHELLSEVIKVADIAIVLEKYFQRGLIETNTKIELQHQLLKIVTHPKLQNYYSENVVAYNEREIVYNHQIVIPDRLVFNKDKRVTVIDYKTGSLKKEHFSQLENYASILRSLSHLVDKKVLIYIDELVTVREF